MWSSDPYLGRRFHMRRYNCWHLVRDAWLDLTGHDLGDLTPEEISQEALARQTFEQVEPSAGKFVEINEPRDPCLVLMLRERDVPHIGMYTRGKVLQITAVGVTFLPLSRAVAEYQRARFYHVSNCDRQGPAIA